MPRVENKEFVTFNDGELTICEVKNRNIVATKAEGVRFGNQTVGINRFWKAKVASSTVDRLVSIPIMQGVTTQNVCIIRGEQYKILQIQEKFDQSPPCLFLTLERIQTAYKDVREGE